jgi:hypothetical protein
VLATGAACVLKQLMDKNGAHFADSGVHMCSLSMSATDSAALLLAVCPARRKCRMFCTLNDCAAATSRCLLRVSLSPRYI